MPTTPTQTLADTPNSASPIITRGYPYPTRIITRGYGFVARPTPTPITPARRRRGRSRPDFAYIVRDDARREKCIVIYRVAAQLIAINDVDVTHLDIKGVAIQHFECIDGDIYIVDAKNIDVNALGIDIDVTCGDDVIFDIKNRARELTVDAVLKRIGYCDDER